MVDPFEVMHLDISNFSIVMLSIILPHVAIDYDIAIAISYSNFSVYLCLHSIQTCTSHIMTLD